MGLSKEDFELAIKEFGTNNPNINEIINRLIELDREKRIKKTIQEKIDFIITITERKFGTSNVDSENKEHIRIILHNGILNNDLESLFDKDNMINYFFKIYIFPKDEKHMEMNLDLRKENIEITKSLLL